MNTDIKDLTSKIKINDPTSVMIIAGLAISMVLFALVATGLVRTVVAQRTLKVDYETTTEAIESLSSARADSPATLQSRVDQAEQQLQDLLSEFPLEDETTGEIARYYEYASLYNTQLLRVESTMPAPALEGAPVFVEYYTLDVRGQVEDLLSFVKHLADSPYDTIILRHVSIAPDGPARAELELAVYYVQAEGVSEVVGDDAPALTPAAESSTP